MIAATTAAPRTRRRKRVRRTAKECKTSSMLRPIRRAPRCRYWMVRIRYVMPPTRWVRSQRGARPLAIARSWFVTGNNRAPTRGIAFPLRVIASAMARAKSPPGRWRRGCNRVADADRDTVTVGARRVVAVERSEVSTDAISCCEVVVYESVATRRPVTVAKTARTSASRARSFTVASGRSQPLVRFEGAFLRRGAQVFCGDSQCRPPNSSSRDQSHSPRCGRR